MLPVASATVKHWLEWSSRDLDGLRRQDIPFSAIEKLWQATAGMGRIPAEDALKAMHRLSLFNRYDARRRALRLHDVIRAYLGEQVKEELPALHGKLLDGYGLVNWAELPDGDYLWQRLAMHLRKAGRNAELYRLIDKPWMDAKLAHFGSHQSFAADVDLAIQPAEQETPPNIVQLIRHSLIYATLGSLATNVPKRVRQPPDGGKEAKAQIDRNGFSQTEKSVLNQTKRTPKLLKTISSGKCADKNRNVRSPHPHLGPRTVTAHRPVSRLVR